MGQEMDGRDWGARWAEAIGRNIASIRKSRGVIAQELADRCGELGFPIPRSTIANIETGRKRDIPVQEIAVIAAALRVPPVRLLFDLRDGASPVEILPGAEALPVEGMEWFSGLVLGKPDDAGLSEARTEHKSRDLAMFYAKRMDDALRQANDARNGIVPADFQDALGTVVTDDTGEADAGWVAATADAEVERYRRALHNAVGKVRQARASLRAAGMTPPTLPTELHSVVEAMGGDV